MNNVVRICVISAFLLNAAPAFSCQLVCVKTNQAYTGNLGGLAGADAKCAAEYPGFKFAREISFLANTVSNEGDAVNLRGRINVDSTANCSNWTSDSAALEHYNVVYNQNANTYDAKQTFGFHRAYAATPCSSAEPIICCNM